MAPKTRKRKPVAKRRKNHVLRDGNGMEAHGQQQNEQEPDTEASRQPIQKQVMARSTRSQTASRNTPSVILDKLQAMENRQGVQPQIFPQASMGQVMGPRIRKATEYRGLEEMDQVEGDGHQNEEEVEFQTTQQTNSRQVTAPRSKRSTVNRTLNHGYLEQDEMEEHGQQEYGRHTNLEVSDALKNALQILMASGSQRATTNQNSYTEFQDNNGQWQHKRQIGPPISQQASVMTPTTRKATGNDLGFHRLQDEIPIEGDGELQNEKQRDFQMTEQVMAPRTRRAITNSNSYSGFRDKNQMKENEQLHNRKQVHPQISHEDSMMASRSRRATTNQSGYHRLREEEQLERDRQHQNEEEPEFLTTRQTKNQQVMTHSTRRSTPGRIVNHGLLYNDEIEEHGQRENEQVSDMEVTQAIENALHILMAPSTRRETTNENSHYGFQDMRQIKESRQQPSMQRSQPRQVSQQASISAVMPPRSQNATKTHSGFQDMHQMKESRQQQSMQRLQPQLNQQASISAVMPPRSQNATRNQSGHHRLSDEDQMDGDEEQQYEEPPEIQMAQQANGLVATMATNESAGIGVGYKETQSARSRGGKMSRRVVARGSSSRRVSSHDPTSDGDTMSLDRELSSRVVGTRLDQDGEDSSRDVETPSNSVGGSDGKLMLTITPELKLYYKGNKIPNTIMKSFEKVRNPTGYNWKETPELVKQRMWEQFKNVFIWPSNYGEDRVRELWEVYARRRYSDFVCRLKKRRADGTPSYMEDDEWKGWNAYWDREDVKNKSEIARKCRLSEPNGPGTGIFKHKGGSKSMYSRAYEMSVERGVSINNVVHESFRYFHMKKDGTYTDEKSKRIDEEVERRAMVLRDSLSTIGEEAGNVDINKICIEVMQEEKKKNRLFGLGSLGDTFLSVGWSSAFEATKQVQTQQSIHKLEELERDLLLEREKREEMERSLLLEREKREEMEHGLMLEREKRLQIEEHQRLQDDRYEAQQRLIQQLLAQSRKSS